MSRAVVFAGLLLLAAQAAIGQTLTLLNPKEPASSTTREFVNVLGRTEPGNTVTVAGQTVPVYATGVFVRDRVPLAPGANALALEVRTPGGGTSQLTLNVQREPPAAPPAWPADRLAIDPASLRPAVLHLLHERETVEVAFSATPGQHAQARWGEEPWFELQEVAPGRYAARMLLRDAHDRFAQPIQLRLSASPGGSYRDAPPLLARTPGEVGLWRSEGVRPYRTGADGRPSTELVHGLHEVRLGGPNLTELPPGVRLLATGRVGEQWRVQLAPGMEAWAPAAALEPLPASAPGPRPEVLNVAVSGSDEGDHVDVPWPATLPYAVRTVAEPGGRAWIELSLFGTHHATTWITHRASARQVREVVAEQGGEGWVRVRVLLRQAQPWGWSVKRSGAALRLVVHAPPVLAAAPASPLKGLRVALEAGHGGPTNLGAVGPTGTPEKDINRWTTDVLRAELEAAGAEVVDVRVGDENPSPRERAERVAASGALLFVSVHANAADTANGYLRAAGTGTFYKHAHSRDAAAAVQRRLLETGLPDLGLVGNFNYAPIRLVTSMPAILVEQAFVSNPQEEALLLDPSFRARLARAVRLGVEDHLRHVARAANQETSHD